MNLQASRSLSVTSHYYRWIPFHNVQIIVQSMKIDCQLPTLGPNWQKYTYNITCWKHHRFNTNCVSVLRFVHRLNYSADFFINAVIFLCQFYCIYFIEYAGIPMVYNLGVKARWNGVDSWSTTLLVRHTQRFSKMSRSLLSLTRSCAFYCHSRVCISCKCLQDMATLFCVCVGSFQ